MAIDFTDRIKPESDSVGRYLEDLLKGRYQIPTFQRDVVWSEESVKKLWDSIYKFYPLGSILLWETDVTLQRHRKIGGHLLKEGADREHKYILDGQQRTTSLLTSIYGGEIASKPGFDPSLYIDLTVELAGNTDDETYRSLFLFWKDIDDRNGEVKQNAGRKRKHEQNLIIRLKDILSNYGVVEERLEKADYTYDSTERKNLRRIRQIFDNYKISHITLRGIEVAEVCQIFERINQAGVPLDIFDIVVAKTFQPTDTATGESGFYLREMFETFRDGIQGAFKNIDDHTMLQMIAVAIMVRLPNAGVINITDTYLNKIQTEHIRSVWPEAQKAIRKVYDFLDNRLHIKGPRLIPSRYFYLSLLAYFLESKKPDYTFLEKYFWFHSFHDDDQLRNATHLKNHINLLQQGANGETDLGKFVIDKNSLRKTKYSTTGRYSRAVLALYANQQPRDWGASHQLVLNEVYYNISDRPNLHHIFPLNYINKHPGTSEIDVNSLMNIAYLTQLTNQHISDKNPLDYIRTLDEFTGFREVLKGHLASLDLVEWAHADEMPENALDIFIEKRVNLIIDCIREKLTGSIVDVIDSANSDVLDKVKNFQQPPASELVLEDENEKVEFKETLRIDTATGKKNPAMEHSCLKTIAAFLNTKGGHLIVGVNNNGKATGIDVDQFENEDKMTLHLGNIIQRSLEPKAMYFIRIRFDDFQEKRVMIVDCEPSDEAVYLKSNGKEEFYIRYANSSIIPSPSQVEKHIRTRFIR